MRTRRMSDNPHFPATLPYVNTLLRRRYIAVHIAQTAILSLSPDGSRASRDDPRAKHGLYVWMRKHWELEGIYNSADAARSAAKRQR
jgi:hypothetical protein